MNDLRYGDLGMEALQQKVRLFVPHSSLIPLIPLPFLSFLSHFSPLALPFLSLSSHVFFSFQRFLVHWTFDILFDLLYIPNDHMKSGLG